MSNGNSSGDAVEQEGPFMSIHWCDMRTALFCKGGLANPSYLLAWITMIQVGQFFIRKQLQNAFRETSRLKEILEGKFKNMELHLRQPQYVWSIKLQMDKGSNRKIKKVTLVREIDFIIKTNPTVVLSSVGFFMNSIKLKMKEIALDVLWKPIIILAPNPAKTSLRNIITHQSLSCSCCFSHIDSATSIMTKRHLSTGMQVHLFKKYKI